MLGIPGDKTRLFDAYARRGEPAEATPEAIEMSEQGLARTIAEAEQPAHFTGPAPVSLGPLRQ